MQCQQGGVEAGMISEGSRGRNSYLVLNTLINEGQEKVPGSYDQDNILHEGAGTPEHD